MDDHWLVRKSTIRGLWIAFAVALAATVLMDLVIEPYPYFGLDGTFGFGAWFGFVSCVVLIAVAKALGVILKRRPGCSGARRRHSGASRARGHSRPHLADRQHGVVEHDHARGISGPVVLKSSLR